MHSFIQLAYDLCAIPSISGNETLAIAFLTSWLKNNGFIIEAIPVDEHRQNIFAYFETRPCYNLIYCSHIDTVAPFFAPRLDERRLFGRGACDAKGILCAMIGAMLNEKARGYSDLALLVTVGEEEASDGAKACNEVLKDRASFVVIGEPTDLKISYGQKGMIVFDLIAHGKEAHSSRPDLGKSAIHQLVHHIHKLLQFSWPTSDVYGETFINFGELRGGTMRNVLAKRAEAKGIMRIAAKADVVIDMVKSQLSSDLTLEIKSKTDPIDFFCPAGFLSFLAGFGTDAPYLKDVGKPILLGPGSMDFAHKDNESIGLHEIVQGVRAYEQIASLCRNDKTMPLRIKENGNFT
jgi:acetylornithine deacetylase